MDDIPPGSPSKSSSPRAKRALRAATKGSPFKPDPKHIRGTDDPDDRSIGEARAHSFGAQAFFERFAPTLPNFRSRAHATVELDHCSHEHKIQLSHVGVISIRA